MKLYNFYVSFPIHQSSKEFMLCSMTSVVTAAHLSTLVATASECPVTIEVILFSHSNFWFNLYMIQSIWVFLDVLLISLISGGSTAHISNHDTSLKQFMWNTTAVTLNLSHSYCLALAIKNYFHSMKAARSQYTKNNTEAQNTSCGWNM